MIVLVGSAPAFAGTVSIGAPAETSVVAGFGTVGTRAGAILETFDNGPGGSCGVQSGLDYFSGASAGDVRFETTEGFHFRVRPDVDNSHTTDVANSSCFASVSTGFLAFPVSAENDFDYLGFYWGSPDPYNSIAFFDAPIGGNAIDFGAEFGAEVTGDELALHLGQPAFGSAYVYFTLAPGETVQRIEIRSAIPGFELDNVVFNRRSPTDLVPVPTPPALALFGLGLAALVRSRRPR